MARNVAHEVGRRCGGLRSWRLQRPSWSNEFYAKKILSSLQELEVGMGDISPDAVNITVGVQTASSRL